MLLLCLDQGICQTRDVSFQDLHLETATLIPSFLDGLFRSSLNETRFFRAWEAPCRPLSPYPSWNHPKPPQDLFGSPWTSFSRQEKNIGTSFTLFIRPVSKDSSLKSSSRPWGFEFLHAYISWDKCWIYYGLAHESMYLDMGFEIRNSKSCKFKSWELTVPGGAPWLDKPCHTRSWALGHSPWCWSPSSGLALQCT